MGIVDFAAEEAASLTPQDFLSSPSLSAALGLSPPQVPQQDFSFVSQDFLSSTHAFFSEQHEPESEQQLFVASSCECAFSPVPQPPQCALAVTVAARIEIVISSAFIIVCLKRLGFLDSMNSSICVTTDNSNYFASSILSKLKLSPVEGSTSIRQPEIRTSSSATGKRRFMPSRKAATTCPTSRPKTEA